MIKKVFLQLGFSEKEYDVYATLLNIGLASAAQVAREMVLPRQTVYTIVQHLVAEGVLDQSDKRGVKQFFADPDKLLAVIEKKKQELDKNHDELKREIAKNFLTGKKKKSFPKITYFEGERGLKRLFAAILEQYKKGERGVFRGYGINTIHGLLSEYIPDFIKERHELGVETHLFIGRGDDDFEITDRSKAYGRMVKRLSMNPQTAGLYIVGNRLYLFSYHDLVGVMIENDAMATLLRSVFDDRWEQG
jgi:sugar-specific transcriptional regulator TrmB